MNRVIMLVGIGSLIGGVCRHYSQQVITRFFPSSFPYGTLAVNITGCFLIGIFYALSDRSNVLTPEWRLFLTTGFCGGFTTFSAFSHESITLIQDGEFINVSLYAALSVVIGIASTYLGMVIVRSL